MNWTELNWRSTQLHDALLVTSVSVTTLVAAAKLGRLVLSRCEHFRWNARDQNGSCVQLIGPMPFVVWRFLVRRMLHVVLHGCAMGKLGMEVVARTSRSHVFIQQNDDQTAIGWLRTGGWSERVGGFVLRTTSMSIFIASVFTRSGNKNRF